MICKKNTANYPRLDTDWGKMLRGASFVYSYSKNEELYSLLEDTVRDMLSVQESSGRIRETLINSCISS